VWEEKKKGRWRLEYLNHEGSRVGKKERRGKRTSEKKDWTSSLRGVGDFGPRFLGKRRRGKRKGPDIAFFPSARKKGKGKGGGERVPFRRVGRNFEDQRQWCPRERGKRTLCRLGEKEKNGV